MDALKTGQVTTWPQVSNPYIDWYIDQCVWFGLQMYFAKYKIPKQAGDYEKFIGTFRLNGVKS